MARQTVAVALPSEELGARRARARDGRLRRRRGPVARELAGLLDSRREFALAVLDGERDFDQSLEYYSLLHDERPRHPRPDGRLAAEPRAADRRRHQGDDQRRVLHPALLGRLAPLAGRGDAHPVADRRRRQGPDHRVGQRPRLGGLDEAGDDRGVFNPKGGVGKTTISINLATTLQVRRDQRVLLVDADTVTGHIANSLGLDQVQTVDDAWDDDQADGNDMRTLAQLATHHPNGSRSPC